MESVFKGDSTEAFGNTFIEIEIDNENLYKISKVLFAINNNIFKPFTREDMFQEPVIILKVNLTSQETARLLPSNIGRLALYDEFGNQLTCPQTLTFNAKDGIITNVRCKR